MGVSYILLQELKVQAMGSLKYWALSHPLDVLLLCYELGLQGLKKTIMSQFADYDCPDMAALHRVIHLARTFECPDALRLAKVRIFDLMMGSAKFYLWDLLLN